MLYLKKAIIIGGPSCSGKTTLINKLKRGELPLLSQQLGIKDPSRWSYIKAKELERICKPASLQLVVHFDTWGHQNRRRLKILSKLINISETIVVLTLCVRHRELLKRNTLRIKKAFFGFFCMQTRLKELHNLWKKHLIYEDPNGVSVLYERWFNTLDIYQLAHHWLLDSTEGNDRIAYKFEKERVRQFLELN